MNHPPCVVYVNSATYRGTPVAKIGISCNPKKRLLEFNNSLRHLRKNGYISERVSFVPYLSIPVSSQAEARGIERAFLNEFKPYLVRDLGVEVVLFPIDLMSIVLFGLASTVVQK